MEIAYYWVEYQENIKSQGFNFDPRIRCAMDVVSDKYYKLKILGANEINIMQGNNISNVSVLLGINGSGKTTLMKSLGSLSCFAEERH